MPERKDVRIIRLGLLKSQRFAGMAHTQQPHLTYNNGPLLANVEIFTVFWGGAWQNQPALASLSNNVNDFFKFILSSPLIDQLNEYSVPGQTIGHGKWVGSKTLITEPGSLIDDAAESVGEEELAERERKANEIVEKVRARVSRQAVGSRDRALPEKIRRRVSAEPQSPRRAEVRS